MVGYIILIRDSIITQATRLISARKLGHHCSFQQVKYIPDILRKIELKYALEAYYLHKNTGDIVYVCTFAKVNKVNVDW